jgi:hypothetical protein
LLYCYWWLSRERLMLSAEECRKRAADCVEQAQGAPEAVRAQLLKLAQNWLVLADDAMPKKTGQNSPAH